MREDPFIEDISVGDLIKQLEKLPKNATLYFEGMYFYRSKQRGETFYQIEFNFNNTHIC